MVVIASALPTISGRWESRVIKGRGFTDQDKAGAPPVVIVNETLARKHWPGEDPIGKRIRFYGPLERSAVDGNSRRDRGREA